jgi:hypothetical protein
MPAEGRIYKTRKPVAEKVERKPGKILMMN